MNFIVINKKIEDALHRALLQSKKEVTYEVYKEIEKILLKAIGDKKLSAVDVNEIMSLIEDCFKPKRPELTEEDKNKQNFNKNPSCKKHKTLFNYKFNEHLYIVKLLNIYKIKMVDNIDKPKINKR